MKALLGNDRFFFSGIKSTHPFHDISRQFCFCKIVFIKVTQFGFKIVIEFCGANIHLSNKVFRVF